MINKLRLTIKRDSKSYEEIFVAIYADRGLAVFNTKQLSNCNSNIMIIEFEAAVSVIIKVRMLNQNSNYTINVHQDYSEVTEIWVVVV